MPTKASQSSLRHTKAQQEKKAINTVRYQLEQLDEYEAVRRRHEHSRFEPTAYKTWERDDNSQDNQIVGGGRGTEFDNRSNAKHEQLEEEKLCVEDNDYSSSQFDLAGAVCGDGPVDPKLIQDEYRKRLEEIKQQVKQRRVRTCKESNWRRPKNRNVFSYTDGYYSEYPFFGIKNELVEPYVERQNIWREKWRKKYPELFSHKLNRFFWPPVYLKMCCKKGFCTRGSYLDFPEVVKDPPHPLPTDLELVRHDIMGRDNKLVEPDISERDAILEKGNKINRLNIPGCEQFLKKKTTQDELYWDDDRQSFLLKQHGEKYFFDMVNGVWRQEDRSAGQSSKNNFEKNKYTKTAHDYFFDDTDGQFHLRLDHKPELYAYYAPANIWRKSEFVDENITTDLKPTDYVFNEFKGQWQKKEENDGSIDYVNGGWKIIQGFRGKSGLGPDDFYYDGRGRGVFLMKDKDADQYYYKPQEGVWALKNVESQNNECPTRLRPHDFYFDADEGKFWPMTKGTAGKICFSVNRQMWQTKRFHPSDFYWDEKHLAYVENPPSSSSKNSKEDIKFDEKEDFENVQNDECIIDEINNDEPEPAAAEPVMSIVVVTGQTEDRMDVTHGVERGRRKTLETDFLQQSHGQNEPGTSGGGMPPLIITTSKSDNHDDAGGHQGRQNSLVKNAEDDLERNKPGPSSDK